VDSRRRIGKTTHYVYPIGLGGMPLSIRGRPDEAVAIKVIHAAIEKSINFIDTADVYCLDDHDLGHNEILIAEALKKLGSKKNVIVATKGGLERPNGEWTNNAKPAHLRQACIRSLTNLQVDCITLYQLHAPDPSVPFEDSVGELAKLQKEGKIQHIGLSNVSLEQLEKALKIVRVESVQNMFNPLRQTDLRNGLLSFCAKEEISYLPYSPVGGGYRHKKLSEAPLLTELAQKYKATSYQVILAWILSLGDNIIPIPGASRVESTIGSAAAIHLKLDPEDCKLIENINPLSI
jgi:aryl-alcohol dehydrogenase-like predicted oxidoreductase